MSNLTDKDFEMQGKRASNFPLSTQFALIKALPNCSNGAFWGFTNIKEIKDFGVAKELMTDKNLKVKQLDNDAVIIEVLPNYLISAIKMVDPNLFNDKVGNNMQSKMVEAEAQFEKWLASHADNYKGLLGIYCTNETTTITYNNKSYPAFRVNETTVLNLLNKWHYIMLDKDNKPYAPKTVKENNAFFKMSHLSPTLTGIFIKVASTLTPEQAKEYRAKFKVQQKGNS